MKNILFNLLMKNVPSLLKQFYETRSFLKRYLRRTWLSVKMSLQVTLWFKIPSYRVELYLWFPGLILFHQQTIKYMYLLRNLLHTELQFYKLPFRVSKKTFSDTCFVLRVINSSIHTILIAYYSFELPLKNHTQLT